MEDVPFVKFKRTRGAPLKYGPDKETSRREIARQRDATKVYLLTSHDEWRSAKQTYERRLRKPITNSEFALHLLSIHRKSKCPTCTNLDQSDGELPLTDTEIQTDCRCPCQCDIEETLAKEQSVKKEKLQAKQLTKKNQGARRRKQSSPQGLHRDSDFHPDSEASFPAVPSNGDSTPKNVSQEGEPHIISTTTKLLQGLRGKSDETEEMENFDEEVEEDEEDDQNEFDEGDEYLEDEELIYPAVKALKRYKEDEEEWKSSEMSDDSADVDYGKPAPKRKRKPRKKPTAKAVTKIMTKVATKPVSKTTPRVTKSAATPKLKPQTTSRPRGAPRGRRKNPVKVTEKVKVKPKSPPLKRGPSMFIRRVSWTDLNKVYQCKICNHENELPLQACRHLLAMHPEIVGALREFLLRNKVLTADEERSLYSIALEEPLPLLLHQHTDQNSEHPNPRTPNASDLSDKTMEARIQHFTEMLMPGYLGTPTALPHLPGMPSFQQSFNRPPLFEGAQNGMVPLPPHSLAPMASATAAIFGVPGIGLPEGQMVPPVSNSSFVSASNNDGLPTSTPSPTTTHSSMVAMGSTNHGGGMGLQEVQQEDEQFSSNHQVDGMDLQNSHRSDGFGETSSRQTTSEPQSPSQTLHQPPLNSPRPSSQPSRLPTQLLPSMNASSSDQLLDPPQQSTQQEPQLLSQPPRPATVPSHLEMEQNQPPTEESLSSLKDGIEYETENPDKVNNNNDEEEEDKDENEETDETNNPFEKEDLLMLLERWVKIPLDCPFCKMKLPYMKRKDKHRCKRPGPSVLCDICGKSYPQTYFRFHYRRVHVPQKKVPCHFCSKEFKPSSLSKHILERHKPSRPYKCGICGKEFNSKKHCDKHEAVHKTEKPHKCPTCNRGFTQRTNMKNHMRQHTGEQPYRCHNCMKSFTHNVSLKNHLKRYHGIDLWQLGHTGGGRPKKE
ncbi:uncharacterized protein [Apostichopus japonicus]|uniref:uncharacterized protein n=1 Tax=Stichopus japonicus TaxID=307972 RepID=UPI003AB36C66